MISEEKLAEVKNFITRFSREEQVWLSGFLAGVNQSHGHAAAAVLPESASTFTGKLTIAYGTETGNSKKIATQLAAKAKQKKIASKIISLEQYKTDELANEEVMLLVISTHGDGEPPAAAKRFYDFVMNASQALPKLKYSVLALGDSSYPLFCKAGADVDEKFSKLGAKKIAARVDCDVDFESDANTWIENVLNQLGNAAPSSNTAVAQAATAETKKPSGKKYYTGKITATVNLNDVGSKKETFHIEFKPTEKVDFQPGDSMGITPVNPEPEVQRLLNTLKTIGSDFVTFKEQRYSFYQLLKTTLSIRQIPQRVLNKYAELEGIEIPNEQFDLDELFQKFPPKKLKGNLQAIVDLLEPIAPRLYSIASSPAAHNGEVHVCVARSSFTKNGEQIFGLASHFLAELPLGTSLQFYIQKNNQFRLPAEDKDVIMVGPGTGIAPFRAFVAERDAQGASGRNWLFFGDQHFKTDFLYQAEWQSYLETGALTRMDVAFSRDTDKKVYVQHKMLLHAKEIYEWLESGAYFYVCGAKEPMSVDVEKALMQIIGEQSGKGNEYAAMYLIDLKEQDRYLKDVY